MRSSNASSRIASASLDAIASASSLRLRDALLPTPSSSSASAFAFAVSSFSLLSSSIRRNRSASASAFRLSSSPLSFYFKGSSFLRQLPVLLSLAFPLPPFSCRFNLPQFSSRLIFSSLSNPNFRASSLFLASSPRARVLRAQPAPARLPLSFFSSSSLSLAPSISLYSSCIFSSLFLPFFSRFIAIMIVVICYDIR